MNKFQRTNLRNLREILKLIRMPPR